MKRHIVVAIHGILNRTTVPTWPDKLDVYLKDCKVERRDYRAAFFAPWNVFVTNWIRARALAAELKLHFPKELPREEWPVLHFAAHSNGCDITLKTVRLLAAAKIKTETIILTGSVTDPDVEKSGVLDLIDRGFLGRAFAYCSADDGPLSIPGVLKWPYNRLGVTGWTLAGEKYSSVRVKSRFFEGYGHGDYFSDRPVSISTPVTRREETFALMRQDMGIG